MARTLGWLAIALWVNLAGAAPELTVNAQIRERAEIRDDRDFTAAAADNSRKVYHRMRLGLNYKPNARWEMAVQGQDSRAWDGQGGNAAQNGLEVQEAWVRANGLVADRVDLIAGRQALSYGNQRLIGAFEWNNVARRFDAIKAVYHGPGWQLDAFGAALGSSPGTGTSSGAFYGLYATWPKLWNGRMEGYALWNNDHASAAKSYVTLGARRTQPVGKWRYDIEAAVQVGDVTAYAAAMEGGRKLGSFDLSAGFCTASGDSTPGVAGGHQTTFQNLYPTNHLHYGYMDFQAWRNLHNVFAKAKAPIGRIASAEVWYNAFWLNNSKDFWYNASGAPNRTSGGGTFRDPTGAAGSEVGQELDLIASLRAGPYLDLQAGYGHFWAGSFIGRINRGLGLSSSGADFVYFQATGHY
ncbi:MAG: alginate export family protein [Armatimonadetes bacterium]|nr:alginate export family protein [Armatimonadota bacterium]